MKNFTSLSSLSLGLVAAGLAAQSCSGEGGRSSAECSGLDPALRAQATLLAYADATKLLRDRAFDVEAQFRSVCNDINRDLGLRSDSATAAEACAILHERVQQAFDAGVTVEAEVAFNCSADISLQAECETSCQVAAMCDLEASCTGGELVVECEGTCSGECDVTAPDFECQGTCEGTCSADIEAFCSGECRGQCTAPRFDGTCDVGCTVDFEGSCLGECSGTCDGAAADGSSCEGTCRGSCTGQATGSCGAQCMGQFSGGRCDTTCMGECVTRGSVACDGSCNGTCTYTPGMAVCRGRCHGECSAALTPPVCTGELSCDASAECHASCEAQGRARVDCPPPEASVVVDGDAELLRAISAHIEEFGAAVNLTLALRDPIAEVAGSSLAVFDALGDVGVAGAACFASSIGVAASAEVSIEVSIEASASLTASSS
jgi:hypothetical protein